MKLMKLNELSDHDLYEFCYATDKPKTGTAIQFLFQQKIFKNPPYLDQVFPNFHYYGQQKVMIPEGEKSKNSMFNIRT